MDRYIGKKLEGRYEILELIGFGGMAIVFKAYDIKEKKHVAVKILKDEYLQNDDFKRRFRNESKAIALLSHPGIVKVLDVNFSDNIQYIVMEHIDGITLKEYIEQQGKVKWKEAVHFTVQILRALQHAHDNGIVHRDVKPQNAMLLEDGTIKVMDFGIARFARENGKTMSDKAIGSVHYISPEQAQGDNTDERTDIYAVGVMLYEMLTGKVPFDGDTPVSVAIKQMQIEPKNPTLLNPDIPIGLEEIILRAMQKDPQLRYQTASEMLRDIDEFKHNPSVIFEYKYLNKDGSTKYFNKIDAHNALVKANQNEPKKKSYTMNILAGVAAACVLLSVVALYFFFKALSNSPDTVRVENFVGLTVAEAESKAPKINFKIVERKQSPDYEEGIIIEQKDKEGSTIKVNENLNIVVSSGIEALNMPDLINQTSSEAKAKLNEMGIENIEVIKKIDSTVPVGRIIQTDPAPNAEIKKTDNVALTVSAGAADQPIKVPTLLGKTEIEARTLLLKVGLSMGNADYVKSDEPKNTIITQSIDPETKVDKGTVVDVEISNGIPTADADIIDKNHINIPISIPAGADDRQVSFSVYVNNVQVQIIELNPSVQQQLLVELVLEDDFINDFAPVKNKNEVMILLFEETFAEYSVNFEKGEITPVTPPKYDLIFENGYNKPNDTPVDEEVQTGQEEVENQDDEKPQHGRNKKNEDED